MDKKQAIYSISGLYPIDSQFENTNEIGKQFMMEAIEETNFDWRNLPEEVLIKWAEKCESKEIADVRKLREKYRN